ncbi:MAG: HD-GYP domain-containing protein [Treponema sp.]|jgi:HD-GYP domain-containing protein (c-di-GMP phosphodiesterase class II)|nr:HD-GYP domain-containing protein [Treponema sp.]
MDDTTEKKKTLLKYLDVIKRVEDIFAKIAMNRFIVNDPFASIAEKIYVDGPQFLEYITTHRGQELRLAKNAVDTAVLALGIAQAMGLADFTIATLLLGSLLHDVGMFCIPQSILTTKDLAKVDQRYILTHPIHGYNVILKELRYHNRIALVALQHHEHWNGTGYPQGLSGTAMTLESRIVAIGDAFAAMTTPRSYRPAMTGHQAMNQLVDVMNSQFDPDILKVFVAFMGIYPRGSLVRLNTGAIARVIDQTDMPLQPCIRMLTYPSGEVCTKEEELDLTEELFITGEAEDKDIV